MRQHRSLIGLDLGQMHEATARAVVSRALGYHDHEPEPAKPPYAVPFLKRFPLGTPDTEIVPFLMQLLQTPELTGSYILVDFTGVGRAVGELFCDAFRIRSIAGTRQCSSRRITRSLRVMAFVRFPKRSSLVPGK
jgi:hypothetical protein